MKNFLKSFQNVILYKGEIYYNTPEQIYLHNRFDIKYHIKDTNILPIDIVNNAIEYEHILIFIGGFSCNMGHLLWDCMYPSWYGLFYLNENNWNKNFQWITLHESYIKDAYSWHSDILEKFSGNKITTPFLLSNTYKNPLKIKLLIGGIKNLGIGCVNKNICINKSFTNHDNDPIETFINRMYLRYKINRNCYNISNDSINNIVYVHSKRKYNGITDLFCKLRNKYAKKYNFIEINWSNCSFENQLKILNSTRIIICGVGTVRANSPFLPNGSFEIQTNIHSSKLPNNISFFDCHLGTISNYLKIININHYTRHESMFKLASKYLLSYIEYALKKIPNTEVINVEDNLPVFVNHIKLKLTENDFINWRNTCSNNIDDIYRYICFK